MVRLIVVQARTGSSRLPGKVLLPLAGKPMLERQLERILAARVPFELVVATTHALEDDAIVELCRRVGVPWFRGHGTDCLDRHLQAARAAGADRVVKIPSDCPLIDPAVIERVLDADDFAGGADDYLSNLHPGSWPDGNDVEVVARSALEIAWREATLGLHREHTTPFIWDQPGRFQVRNVRWESGLDLSRSHRFTVDYPEDYALATALYDALHLRGARPFGLAAILELLERRPELLALNARHLGRSWMNDHREALLTLREARP
jgi:spore coat polysaccharide biosynthesis protein SpsF